MTCDQPWLLVPNVECNSALVGAILAASPPAMHVIEISVMVQTA